MADTWRSRPRMKAYIKAIRYAFPEQRLENSDLARAFPEWSVEKIENKTGIQTRYIARDDECASDLGEAAARLLFTSNACDPAEIDFLLLCTQSPDYLLPTTACVLQSRLGLPTSCGALDFNLGCSGFVYGLGIAKGLIETGQAKKVLLVTAETYSKFLHPGDRSVRTIFGDAAAATLIAAAASTTEFISSFRFGTDGSGAKNLIVPTGGMRQKPQANPPILLDENGNRRTVNHLYMNGPEIFNFTLKNVPKLVAEVLALSGIGKEQVDRFVFHQANRYMLEYLCKKLGLQPERFEISMGDCGNTVSSTIPIALKQAADSGRLENGQLTMLVGFGVGYSWAGCLVRWNDFYSEAVNIATSPKAK